MYGGWDYCYCQSYFDDSDVVTVIRCRRLVVLYLFDTEISTIDLHLAK
jgi:hypothetical protein